MSGLITDAVWLRKAVLLGALAAPYCAHVWSQPLPPAYFQVLVQGRSASFSDSDFRENRGVSINASLDLTGVDQHGFFSQSVIEARTTGGMQPMADVQGSAIFGLAAGSAIVSYGFRAVPVNPSVVAPGPIPVFMRSAASVSASTDPANVGDAAGRAHFRIDEAADAFRDPRLQNFGPGFRGFSIAAVVQEDGSAAAEFSETFRLGLSSGGHGIELLALGASGISPVGVSYEFQSVIDPVFWVDPVAAFDGPGGPVRYADAYRLEFSEGVLPSAIPEPSMVILFAAGLALMPFRRGRFRQRIRTH
jgi:hypothetical protein